MPKRKAFSNNEKFSFGLKLLSKMDIVFLLTLLSIATILNYTLADNVYCPDSPVSQYLCVCSANTGFENFAQVIFPPSVCHSQNSTFADRKQICSRLRPCPIRSKRDVVDTVRSSGHSSIPILRVGTVERIQGNHRLIKDDQGRKKFVPQTLFHLIVETLAKIVTNTTDYEIIVPKDNIFGTIISSNNSSLPAQFSGVIGLLQRNEADVGAGLFSVLDYRRQAVDFSKAFDWDQLTILMKSPERASKEKSLIDPFKKEVWYFILIASCIMGGFINVFIRIMEPMVSSDCPKSFRNFLSSAMDSSWFVYGALLRQSSILDPKASSVRILFATWWIFVQVLTSFYTAELTAVLTISDSSLPVKSLDDIRNDKNAIWVGFEGGAFQTMVELDPSFEPLRQDLLNGRGKYILSVKDALDLILNTANHYVLIDTNTASNQIFLDVVNRSKSFPGKSNKVTCRFSYPTGYTFGETPLAMIVRKDAKKILHALDDLVESFSNYGILEHLLKKNQSDQNLNKLCKIPDDLILVWSDLIMIFYLMAFGYCYSTIIFLTEPIVKKVITLVFRRVKDESKGVERYCDS